MGSMIALLRESDVTHVAGATDHVIESFRNDLFPGYKTGEGIDPDLLSQFPLAEEALFALGIHVWPMIEFEADDALASAAAQLGDRFEQVLILSPDKDLCQCVRGSHVVTVDRRRGRVFDENAVRERLGVAPSSVPDLLALVGDAADGIPGIRGWGMKSAATVLNAYGILEAIPLDASNWTVRVRGAARLAEALAEEYAAAMLYKQLATLRTDVPLGVSVDDLRWRGLRAGAYQALCDRLGFRELAERPRQFGLLQR